MTKEQEIPNYSIEIDKQALRNLNICSRVSEYVFGLFGWNLITALIWSFIIEQDYIYTQTLPVTAILWMIYKIFQYKNQEKNIETLTYTIENNGKKLQEKRECYTSRKTNTAHLQIINSVDIEQGLTERIFGIYHVEVDYGMAAEGYKFTFEGLPKTEAEKIATMIKTTGKIGVKIE